MQATKRKPLIALAGLLLTTFLPLSTYGMDKEGPDITQGAGTQEIEAVRTHFIEKAFQASLNEIKQLDTVKHSCFISHAWPRPGIASDQQDHQTVGRIVQYLKLAGINVIYDQGEPEDVHGLKGGQQLHTFMRQLSTSRCAMALFTPAYKAKAKDPSTGVYQEVAKFAEILRTGDTSFYIPALLAGKAQESIPEALKPMEAMHYRLTSSYTSNFYKEFFSILEDKLINISPVKETYEEIKTGFQDNETVYRSGEFDEDLLRKWEEEQTIKEEEEQARKLKAEERHKRLMGQ